MTPSVHLKITLNLYRSRPRAQRGAALLLLTLLVDAVLLLTVLGYSPFFQTVILSTHRSYLRDQSVALAEAGLHEALWEINYGGRDFLGWTDVSAEPTCADLGGTTCFARNSVALSAGDGSGQNIGSFSVLVVNPGSTNPIIRSQGFLRTTSLSTTIRVPLRRTQTTFRYAAFGVLDIAGDSTIDSYSGTYDPANPGTHGDIGTGATNGISGVGITGNATVNGTLYAPESLTNDPYGLGMVSGGFILQNPEEILDIVVPSDLLSASNQGTLTRNAPRLNWTLE